MEPSFGDLPHLVLRKIFRMMPSLKEAIRCSLVCRNWRAAYEMMVRPECLCLHLQMFVHLNHRLFHTNERVDPFAFFKHPDHSQFLRSEVAMSHFRQIKKLILFIAYPDYALPTFHLQEQLNHFESLEYVELFCETLVMNECEINLPNLKIFSCDYMRFDENAQVVLNTPSLEAIRLVEYSRKCSEGSKDSEGLESSAEIANFKFLFPEKLKYLELYNHKTAFKFDIEFPNLECLVFVRALDNIRDEIEGDQIEGDQIEGDQIEGDQIESEIRGDYSERPRLFGDGFLESLPSLRFLYYDEIGRCRDSDMPVLEEEKRKLNRKDLNIYYNNEWVTLDYKNWPKYVEHRNQLSRWPDEKWIAFDQLIDSKIPLDLFKENYLRVFELKVRQVDDQSLLVDFLRKVQVRWLALEYDCNLGQSFLDEIAGSITTFKLVLDECVWNRLSDLSVLSRLNVFYMEVFFQQFRREVVSAVLRNPACVKFNFYPYDGFEDEEQEDWLHGDIRKEYHVMGFHSHNVRRVEKEFYCEVCCWISRNEPRSECPIEVTLQHIEGEHMSNTTDEEAEHIRVMTQELI